MSDDAKGKILTEFVGVSAKMYSFNGQIRKLAVKGVKKKVAKRCLTHETFRTVLFEQRKLACQMNMIRSKNHMLESVNVPKPLCTPLIVRGLLCRMELQRLHTIIT